MDTLLDTIIGFQISWPLATMLGKDLHDDMYYIDLDFKSFFLGQNSHLGVMKDSKYAYIRDKIGTRVVYRSKGTLSLG